MRRNAAVKSEWSSIDSVYQVEIPAGTKLYEGYVAPQGSKYTGSGKQIFIEKPWDIPGVKDKVKKITGQYKIHENENTQQYQEEEKEEREEEEEEEV